MPRLFAVLDVLAVVARRMHPPYLDQLAALVRDPAAALLACDLDQVEASIQQSARMALQACDRLLAATRADNPMRAAYRAMRYASRSTEALIDAENLPAVSRILLPPDRRDDALVLDRLARPPHAQSGLHHFANQTSERGGFSVYVPNWYDPARPWPVVMALHGGSGHGRLFLTNWVSQARARGLIVIAPTAVGDTWSLMDPEVDSNNLASILARVRARWSIDPAHMLLTGMSDGGTFTLLSGVDADSPFSHLAPVAGTFHPLLLAMADPARLSGLPVYLTHGALDWMFRVSIARTAQDALRAAGAAIVYREVADLSHTYPVDEQDAMLDWFLQAGRER
jgi:phospholipase/carboxylesterase